ncbi:MAG: hypothetical protein MK101_02605 [Phycisphaerales bacterium]|nr:hypothetical protein [Phycisphaerales bacterium]
MARTKKKPTRSSGRGRSSKGSAVNWSARERWIALTLLIVATGATLMFVPSLRALAQAPHQIQEVRFQGAPPWAGDTLLRHLAETALHAAGSTTGAHERTRLCEVRTALDDTGWFASVDQVSHDARGALIVRAAFLAPRAIVEDRYGAAIVDGKGRLLPEGCRLDPSAHVIHLVHPRAHRPVRARRTWESDDVHAALTLLDHVEGRDWMTQIDAIDLAGHARNGSLVLVTDTGSQIIWGSAPGQETPLEALWERKLVRLDHLFGTSGRVDQHHSGEIDLTDASVVVRR